MDHLTTIKWENQVMDQQLGAKVEFSIKQSAPEFARTACLAVGIYENTHLTDSATRIDRTSNGGIRAVIQAGDFSGKTGASRILYGTPNISAERVLLVGLGKKENFGAKEYCESIRTAVNAANGTGAKDLWISFVEIEVPGRTAEWRARHLVTSASEASYRFEELKSKKSSLAALSTVILGLSAPTEKNAMNRGLTTGRAIANGTHLSRDLSNLPGNICTPSYLAKAALSLSKECDIKVKILDRKELERLNMWAFLSVAKGSKQPPKFIVMSYKGASKATRPVVLIGKGVTFDTGGISIKSAGEMDEMKFDMCGAAAVMGTMRAVAEMRLQLNVIGLVPATENMPGGAASKPGDIVTSMSGQTVEILNTDAEGRLILCDALTYAERFNPSAVVDVATLTGACVIALGHVCSGLFSNSDALAAELLSAGEESWDRTWRLPLWDDYQEQLKSNFADFANIGGRAAGCITAACFLSRFTKNYDWAHLDIAGIAWRSGKEKGATGRPIPMLTSFLINKAKAKFRR